jgi:hypothetical protein
MNLGVFTPRCSGQGLGFSGACPKKHGGRGGLAGALVDLSCPGEANLQKRTKFGKESEIFLRCVFGFG